MRKYFLYYLGILFTMIPPLYASDRLQVAEKSAHAAGEILLSYWNQDRDLSVKEKAPQNYVTKADYLSEEKIINIIKQNFPDDAILAEESGYQGPSSPSYLWIIDALDGTTNFIRNRSEFSISIGIVELKSSSLEYVGGVIYAPLEKQTFKAWQGKGAFQNGQCLKVSQKSRQDAPLLTIELNEEINSESQRFQSIKMLLPYTDVLRARTGSAVLDLARVACGQHDAFISYGLHVWDVAAATVIIKEAGGQVHITNWGQNLSLSHPLLKENVDIVASNASLYQDIMQNMRPLHKK